MHKKLIGAALLIAASNASAQSPDSRPAVHILVEKLDEDAALCGVNEGALYGAASSSLRYNRVREGVSSLNNPTLYVNVNSASSGRNCAISIHVELYQYQTVNLRGVGEVWGKAQLCSKGALGLGQGGTALTATTKDLIDACLSGVAPLVLKAIS